MHVHDYYSTNGSGGGAGGADLSWLREVRDEHIRLSLEWRSPFGDNAVERRVDESTSGGSRIISRPHPDLDVAELIVPTQIHGDQMLCPAFPLGSSIREQDEVRLVGHNLCVDEESDELEGRMVPNQEAGRVELVSGFRTIVSTGKAVLQMGMCGGAVLGDQESGGPVVLGMVEGILPRGTASGQGVADKYPEHACVLLADKLSEFLSP
eukprot:g209.t1